MNKSIVFSFPLTRPHCGVPLSNGNFGALVWGGNTLNVTVNQNDLWDHRGGELVDDAIDRRRSGRRVQRSENQVTRLRGLHGDRDRLQVPHLQCLPHRTPQCLARMTCTVPGYGDTLGLKASV